MKLGYRNLLGAWLCIALSLSTWCRTQKPNTSQNKQQIRANEVHALLTNNPRWSNYFSDQCFQILNNYEPWKSPNSNYYTESEETIFSKQFSFTEKKTNLDWEVISNVLEELEKINVSLDDISKVIDQAKEDYIYLTDKENIEYERRIAWWCHKDRHITIWNYLINIHQMNLYPPDDGIHNYVVKFSIKKIMYDVNILEIPQGKDLLHDNIDFRNAYNSLSNKQQKQLLEIFYLMLQHWTDNDYSFRNNESVGVLSDTIFQKQKTLKSSIMKSNNADLLISDIDLWEYKMLHYFVIASNDNITNKKDLVKKIFESTQWSYWDFKSLMKENQFESWYYWLENIRSNYYTTTLARNKDLKDMRNNKNIKKDDFNKHMWSLFSKEFKLFTLWEKNNIYEEVVRNYLKLRFYDYIDNNDKDIVLNAVAMKIEKEFPLVINFDLETWTIYADNVFTPQKVQFIATLPKSSSWVQDNKNLTYEIILDPTDMLDVKYIPNIIHNKDWFYYQNQTWWRKRYESLPQWTTVKIDWTTSPQKNLYKHN